MNNEDVNFEYTLPADINLVESESPVKNRKVKSNGKAKNEDHEHFPECEYNEAFEDNNQNDEFDKSYEDMENLEKYKQNYGEEDEFQDENNDEKKEEKIEEKNTKIKFENVNENLNNTNNMTIISQNKNQSKFMSTVNDNSKKISNPSRLQQAEMAYDKVQMKMNKIFEEDEKLEKLEEKKDYEVLSDVYIQQNLKLIKNLEEFSQILNILIEASRITAKKQELEKKENPKKKKKKVIIPPNNEGNTTSENKLVEVFKIEYNRLKGRVEQLNGLNYEENLMEKSKEISQEITLIETENRSLKLSQKQSEAKFERQGKNPKESNVDLKKASADYMNLRILNEQLIEKVQKNKIDIEENEKKLGDLNTKLEKNKEIAENYGITEEVLNKKSENTGKTINEESKQKESLRVNMLKKCEVLEKVSLSNKKKYEAEIARNIKAIYNLENNIRDLYSVHNQKSKTAYLNNMKFSEIYDMYNATTSSTINSNLKEPTKNNLVKINEQINNRHTSEKQIISPNNIKEKKRIEKENYDKAKPLPKIKTNHQQEQVKRKVKTEKIRNLEIKNKDPSIEPDNDDTYFTNVSPLMVKPVVNEKDKALHDSLLKAKEFIKGIQNNSHGNLNSLDAGQSVCEYKVENTEKNCIHNVDDEPISEMLKKYENLNNKISIKNNDLIVEEVEMNSEKNISNENITKNNILNDRISGLNESKNGHNHDKDSNNNKHIDLNPNTFKAAISGEIVGTSNDVNDFKFHSSFETNNKLSIKDKNLLVQINNEGNNIEQKKISVRNNNDLDDLIL